MTSSQATLGEFRSSALSGTTEITRTIKCRLETSQRKNERLQSAIDEWQEIAAYMADLLPSFPDYSWGETNNSQLWRIVNREFEYNLKAHTAHEAAYKVTEAFGAWRENGAPGRRPQFGDGNYMRFAHDDIEIAENDRGFGVKLGVEPYNPEWFHLNVGEHQQEYLERLTRGEADNGSGEVHMTDSGEAFLHLTVTYDVDVYEPDGVSRYVGVDIGENVLYAAAVVTDDETPTVEAVTMESGREFRHHRERLKQKRARLQEKGDLRGVKEIKDEHERYTEQVLGTASREIVDLAREYAPCSVILEDMTDYRETADDPIHDFPYANLQEKIAYKSTGEGLPVELIDPSGTSITCRKCGATNPQFRDGADFSCWECGYEVHADVHAAINVASSAI